jgi:uncharacterized membrane protein (Fun14 family)
MFGHSDTPKPPDRPALMHAVKTMPSWKVKLLSFGLLLGCIGVGGQVASNYMKGPAPLAPPTHVAPNAAPAPTGSNGFVNGQPAYPTTPPATPAVQQPSSPTPAPSPTLLDAVTPFMSHFGFSLFVGIVVGLIFRTFIRVALLFSALIVGGAMALSYFGHINIDLGTVKTDTSQAVSWLMQQGTILKGMIFQALPSSTAAGVGFLLGFKRR